MYLQIWMEYYYTSQPTSCNHFLISITVTIITIATITVAKIAEPTTMPAMQPAEHPTLDSDCAGSTFTVVSVFGELDSVVVGGTAVVSDVVNSDAIVVGSV